MRCSRRPEVIANAPFRRSGLAKTSRDFLKVRSTSDARKLTFLGIVDRDFLSVAYTETASSIAWFAPAQDVKCEQNLTDLAPKGCFISAKAVESTVGQIGETQKATRELMAGLTPVL
jgi:hypothetical protein